MTTLEKLKNILKASDNEDFELSDKDFIMIFEILGKYKNFPIITKSLSEYLDKIDLSTASDKDFQKFYKIFREYFFKLRKIRDYREYNKK